MNEFMMSDTWYAFCLNKMYLFPFVESFGANGKRTIARGAICLRVKNMCPFR